MANVSDTTKAIDSLRVSNSARHEELTLEEHRKTSAEGIDLEAAKFLSDRLFKVIIGPEDKESGVYFVQEALLISRSYYFYEAIQNERFTIENNQYILRLPEEDKDIWEVLIYWVFNSKLPTGLKNSGQRYGLYNSLIRKLIRIYLVADKYFGNEKIIDRIEDELEEAYGSTERGLLLEIDMVKQVFMGLGADNELRKLFARELAGGLVRQIFKKKDIQTLESVPDATRSITEGYRSFYEKVRRSKSARANYMVERFVKSHLNPEDDSSDSDDWHCELTTQL